ncbi:MAG: AMP-binding protein, partial [Gammaproteobacteria bacterium]
MLNTIDTSLDEKRSFKPSKAFVKKALLNKQKDYDRLYHQSMTDREVFWGEIAEQFTWKKRWQRVCNWDDRPFARWFEGAKLNITENCLDRHLADHKEKLALIWQGEDDVQKKFTYQQLHQQVCTFANVLKDKGVKPGDRVAIYLPMVPELVISVLACARLGAVHVVVFAGFSAPALMERINDATAKIVITADGGFRNGKIIPLKNTMDTALEKTACVQHCIVVKRAHCDHAMIAGRDHDWQTLLSKADEDCPAEPMDACDPLFILHTSGSTGKPKGIQHNIAGYMVGVATSFKYLFDIKKEDVYWCTADIGWITGHSYLVYGPLLNAATVLMYEGAPFYPQPDRFWKIIQDHQVSILYTAPTAIRAAMQQGDQWLQKHDLSSLRLLGSVGEPINPKAWMWYHSKVGAEKCPIVDTWWQT